jgi:transcriptional regulator
VADAPADYISRQLRGIIGIEMRVEAATGKAKLSQNRSRADLDGVIASLLTEPNSAALTVVKQMQTGSSFPSS